MNDPATELAASAAIVAVGARTPIGLDACQTGFMNRAGFASMGPADLGPEEQTITICHQTCIDETIVGPQRALQLATPALEELMASLANSGGALGVEARIKLVLCLDSPTGDLANDSATPSDDVVAAGLLGPLRKRWPAAELEVIRAGPAGLCGGLPAALEQIASGVLDCVIVGGVHSDFDPDRIAQLMAAERLYDHDNLDAIIAGESAAFAALVAPAFARQHGLAACAEVWGIGGAMEPARLDNELSVAQAKAATDAMREATRQLEQQALRAGWVLSDVGFEVWRMREYQSLIVRAANVLGPPYRIDLPAQRIGELGGAAGPLLLVLAAEGFRAGYAAAPIALCLLGSDSGERGAIVVAAPRRD